MRATCWLPGEDCKELQPIDREPAIHPPNVCAGMVRRSFLVFVTPMPDSAPSPHLFADVLARVHAVCAALVAEIRIRRP